MFFPLYDTNSWCLNCPILDDCETPIRTSASFQALGSTIDAGARGARGAFVDVTGGRMRICELGKLIPIPIFISQAFGSLECNANKHLSNLIM